MGGNSSTSVLPASVTSGTMSQQNQDANSGAESKPKKKICCACPETKRLRDECMVQNGEEACAKWIEAHKMCLRSEGFDV